MGNLKTQIAERNYGKALWNVGQKTQGNHIRNIDDADKAEIEDVGCT